MVTLKDMLGEDYVELVSVAHEYSERKARNIDEESVKWPLLLDKTKV